MSFTTTNFQNVGPFGPLLEHCISYYESLGIKIEVIGRNLNQIRGKYDKKYPQYAHFDVVPEGFQKHLMGGDVNSTFQS